MASDADRILHGIIDRQLRRSEFSASSAADAALAPIAKLDDLRPIDIPNLRPIVVDGLKYRAKQYQPSVNAAINEAASSFDDEQADFNEIDSDFNRMLHAPAALDELEGTVRLPPIGMSLEQLRLHIALKRRKAGQTWKNADRLDRLITRHLAEWEADPERTLGSILYGTRSDVA